MRDPRLPTGATGASEGFLGASGFGDFSRITSILGVTGFSSGALISGTFGFSAGYTNKINSFVIHNKKFVFDHFDYCLL